MNKIMFRNTVLKTSVSTKKWMKGAAIRAVKTMAQTAVALIPASQMIQQVDWKIVFGTATLSGIVSVLTSVAGIPECEEEQDEI